jgi:hypothetical protein
MEEFCVTSVGVLFYGYKAVKEYNRLISVFSYPRRYEKSSKGRRLLYHQHPLFFIGTCRSQMLQTQACFQVVVGASMHQGALWQ